MTAPHVYCITKSGNGPKVSAALAQGCGGILTPSRELLPGPVVMWGDHELWFSVLKEARVKGRDWYYADHAYFGRGIFFRVTKNRLQWDGSFYTDGRFDARLESTSNLLAQHKVLSEITIAPRRTKDDGFVLVCPPSEALSERSGFKQAAWTDKAVRAIRRYSKRQIVIRQKPQINRTPAPLLKALEGAWCAVTYTSNVATEAMLGGYPCFTTGAHPAQVFGNTDLANIERPFLPDPKTLKDWAATLCAHQWTLEELRKGEWFNGRS